MDVFNWADVDQDMRLEGPISPEPLVAFDPSFKWMAATGKNNMLLLWRIESADWRKSPYELHGFEGKIASLAFDEDGNRLVAVGRDQTVRYWNLFDLSAHTRPIRLHGHGAGITALKFSDDGESLAQWKP